jgi:hypothetical protein
MEEKGSKLTSKKREIETERYQKEIAQCTFTPKINKTIHFNVPTPIKENRREKVERNVDTLLRWGQEKDLRLAGKRMMHKGGREEDFTFMPEILDNSKKIVGYNNPKGKKIVHVSERLYGVSKKGPKAQAPEIYSYKPQLNKKSQQMMAKKDQKKQKETVLQNLSTITLGMPVGRGANSPDLMDRKIHQIMEDHYLKSSGKKGERENGFDIETAPVEGSVRHLSVGDGSDRKSQSKSSEKKTGRKSEKSVTEIGGDRSWVSARTTGGPKSARSHIKVSEKGGQDVNAFEVKSSMNVTASHVTSDVQPRISKSTRNTLEVPAPKASQRAHGKKTPQRDVSSKISKTVSERPSGRSNNQPPVQQPVLKKSPKPSQRTVNAIGGHDGPSQRTMDGYVVKKNTSARQKGGDQVGSDGSDGVLSNLSSAMVIPKSIKFDRRRDEHKTRTPPPLVQTIVPADNFMPNFANPKSPKSQPSSEINSFTNISQSNSAYVSPENDKKYNPQVNTKRYPRPLPVQTKNQIIEFDEDENYETEGANGEISHVHSGRDELFSSGTGIKKNLSQLQGNMEDLLGSKRTFANSQLLVNPEKKQKEFTVSYEDPKGHAPIYATPGPVKSNRSNKSGRRVEIHDDDEFVDMFDVEVLEESQPSSNKHSIYDEYQYFDSNGNSSSKKRPKNASTGSARKWDGQMTDDNEEIEIIMEDEHETSHEKYPDEVPRRGDRFLFESMTNPPSDPHPKPQTQPAKKIISNGTTLSSSHLNQPNPKKFNIIPQQDYLKQKTTPKVRFNPEDNIKLIQDRKTANFPYDSKNNLVDE